MKAVTLVTVLCLLLLLFTGCGQAGGAPSAAPSPSHETVAIPGLSEAVAIPESASYDDMFTDINDAVFTTREANATGDNSNYFRLTRIDVVDENGFDHQGIVVVCEGSENFTQAYHEYTAQIMELYGDDMGVIQGYRNAATNGDRTYRNADIDFFCIQDIVFTDSNNIERAGVVIALDGSDEYVAPEASLYSDFRDAYWQSRKTD